MRRHYRALALAISLGAATLASAQSSTAGSNPTSRSPNGDVFFYSPLNGAQRGQTIGNPLANTGIGRPNPRNHHQVTPVPEPSQWAMMLAGLVLVGFIVRRNAKRS
jgi:hypothetical protein